MSDLALLRILEQNALEASHEGRDAVRVGAFLALLHRTTDVVWVNHAVPLGAVPDGPELAAQCRELRELFRARQRVLRFEFFAELWPALGPQLEAQGLRMQARQPILGVRRETLRPATAPGVRVEVLTAASPETTLLAAYDVACQGFGEALGGFDPEAQRALLASGAQRVAVAYLDEEAVACGTLTPAGGITEMVGVATIPAARRRGAARAVCSALAEGWFERGGELVWLSAGDEAATRLYEGLGFERMGELLNYIDDAAPAP